MLSACRCTGLLSDKVKFAVLLSYVNMSNLTFTFKMAE